MLFNYKCDLCPNGVIKDHWDNKYNMTIGVCNVCGNVHFAGEEMERPDLQNLFNGDILQDVEYFRTYQQ